MHRGSRSHDMIPDSLWQLSSVAWGSVPAAKVRKAIADHAENGYTAFGRSFPLAVTCTKPSANLVCRHGASGCHAHYSQAPLLTFPPSHGVITYRAMIRVSSKVPGGQAHPWPQKLAKTIRPSADIILSLAFPSSF